MWDWFTNQGLRTFCHLRNERSFDFGNELHSLICHRCSGIYSGFLIFFVMSFFLKYRGSFRGSEKNNSILILGCVLLSLSGIQVLIQKVTTDPLFTGGSARFIIGSLTGLGLLHLYFGLQETKEKPQRKLWIPLVLLFTLLLHALLSHGSLWWVNITSLAGLVFVYILMNALVIESLLPKITYIHKILLTLACIGLEWSLLYWNNISRHQHG